MAVGEKEEKSNHNLKRLVWKGAIYPRMRLKALFVFLVSFAPPSPAPPLALRAVEAVREREREQI